MTNNIDVACQRNRPPTNDFSSDWLGDMAQIAILTDSDRKLVRAAEERLGVTFTDPAWLIQALTHRSFLNEQTGLSTPSNERLEFLGDSALGFIIGHYLFERFETLSEGELTARRAALIRTSTLAGWARELDLASVMRLSQGELTAGVVRDSLLADAFEAILAAILLDQGLPALSSFLDRLLARHADALLELTTQQNYKGLLQEIVQEREHLTPAYRTIAVSGPDHDSLFTVEVVAGERVLGIGTGRSKQMAQQAAAQQALNVFRLADTTEAD